MFQGQETNTNALKEGAYRDHSYNYLCQGLACPQNNILVPHTVSNGDKINITTLTYVHVKQNVKGHSKKRTTNLKQALELLLSALVVQPREEKKQTKNV